jgi:hypothetical protein
VNGCGDARVAGADNEDVEAGQSASTMVTLAMPPPSHMVCSP